MKLVERIHTTLLSAISMGVMGIGLITAPLEAAPLSDPSQIAFNKTCTLPATGQLNAQIGQTWSCSVDVSVPHAPFDGTLNVADVFSSYSTAAQITGATSLSNNFDCASLPSCVIDGANFDASGVETIEYELFLTSIDSSPWHSFQNCTSGTYVDLAGLVTPISGNCVQGRWSPELSATKVCEPLVLMAGGNYQMDCDLTLTATNLPTSGFVNLVDILSANAPNITGVVGQMTNVTSAENWSCLDLTTVPLSVNFQHGGLCQLSPADLLAAGGTSTLNMTFEIEAQPGAFVSNCVRAQFAENANEPNLEGVPAIPSATDFATWNASLPDGCVGFEIPASNPPAVPVSLTKTCTPNSAAVHGGVLGQMWNCSIEATTPQAPFAGTVTLQDAFSSFDGIDGDIVSATSVSGNADCSDPTSCIIDGANFDSSGSETIDLQLFLTSPQYSNHLAFKNCARGSFDDGSGAITQLYGNCIDGSWDATYAVTKTCSPISQGTNAAYQIDCSLTVTGANLLTGTRVVLRDQFGAQFPGVATVSGQMTNVTSTENWSCADIGTFGGSNTGNCNLSSADLLAAGSSSTLNMSFEFDMSSYPGTSPNSPELVANCATLSMSDNTSSAGQRSATNTTEDPFSTTTRSQALDDWQAGLNEGCVGLEIPDSFDISLENVGLQKTCAAPVAGQHGGTSGYLWDCDIAINVNPAPYNGTFTLDEDASAIVNANAQFLSSSIACSGLNTDQLSCQIDPAQMTSPTTVSVQLFAEPVDSISEITWQNCATGTAISGDVTQAGQSCASTTIKPEVVVVSDPPKELEIKKVCDTPVLGQISGASGYLWNCDIHINVIPAPFAGTFTLDEDASHIGNGTAAFLSASVPCTGLQTDHLNCEIDGATMTSPSVVSVQLFAQPDDWDEAFEWENCATGIASHEKGDLDQRSCVSTVIKPEVVKDPPPQAKEISLKKSCGEPQNGNHDGVAGKLWSCEVTVTAQPAPFSGSFTFTEDASSVIGTTSANILSYQSASGNPAWNCTGTFPTPTTDCTISGAQFSTSNVETLSFDLFAADEGNDVKWTNCVSGTYTPFGGKPRGIKGNCVDTSWTSDPKEPPEFSLKKACRGPSPFGDGQRYLCTISVSQTGGAPITSPLTLHELFANTAGTPATDYLLQLIGSNGWACTQPNFANGANCTIQPNDFNGASGHQISGIFLIPNAVLAEQDFENCASLTMKDEEVATAPCVAIDEPVSDTTFDVAKICKAMGDRMVLGASGWTQPWQCTLSVTTNGVPFTDPLWVMENLLYGATSGNAQISSITSADPWQCVSPPFAAPGQGNQPACVIAANDFPHAQGQSDLTVDMLVFGTLADQNGAENCVSIALADPKTGAPTGEISQDCFEIVAPPVVPTEPSLDIVKTCDPAVLGSDGIWTAECEIVVDLAGFDPQQYNNIKVFDELTTSAPQTALTSLMPFPTMGNGSWGPTTGTPAGYNIGSGMTPSYVDANGNGTITVPYTATFSGPGGLVVGSPQTQNCAWVEVSSLNLRAPSGPIGNEKYCVPIEFKLSAIGGPIIDLSYDDPLTPNFDTGVISVDPNIGNPVIPDGSIDGTGVVNVETDMAVAVIDPIVPMGPPNLDINKTCLPATYTSGNQWDLNCTLTLTVQNLPHGEHLKVTDQVLLGQGISAHNSAWSALGVACTGPVHGASCFIPTDNFGPSAFGPAGQTITIPYSTTIFSADNDQASSSGTENCVRTSMFESGQWTISPENSSHPYQMICVPVIFDMSTVTDPITGPLTGEQQNCSIDTFFITDTSGSMNGTRLAQTKLALHSAMSIFAGNGSKSGVLTFNSGTTVLGGNPSQILPSVILNSEITTLSAGGATNWKLGLRLGNTYVANMPDKPLVLFITDGAPNQAQPMPYPVTPEAFVDQAVPYVNALRAQGSRVIGINIGPGAITQNMTRLLGANVATAGANATIDPFVNDVIVIPTVQNIVPVFEQIAAAYCPGVPKMTAQKRQELEAKIGAIPKSHTPYAGDDEFPTVNEETGQVVPDLGLTSPESPVGKPNLNIEKTQLTPCVADRASQSYQCNFRLSVANSGTAPFAGPLVVTDTFGKPAVKSFKLLSQDGWDCAGPAGSSISCVNGALNLAAGSQSQIDLSMTIAGLRDGGTFQNCGAVGIPDNRTQRVAAIQQVMNERGLKAGPVDGKPGSKTYGALAKLQETLGLPVSRDFDDALFEALGLPIQKPGEQSCVSANLPKMPAPVLQCDRATTVKNGESCACRFDNMSQRNKTSCQCRQGYALKAGQGCVKQVIATPKPTPTPTPDTALQCDPKTALQKGNGCVCRYDNMKRRNARSCQCRKDYDFKKGIGCIEEGKPTPKPAPDVTPLKCDKSSTYLRGDVCACIDHENAKKVSATQCACAKGQTMRRGKCLTAVSPTTVENGVKLLQGILKK